MLRPGDNLGVRALKHSKTRSLAEKLKAERERALLKLARLHNILRSEIEADVDEADSGLEEREQALALLQSLERKLGEIDYALRQIHAGKYGVCVRCGERIDPARLDAVPETTLCIKCKVIVERESRIKAIADRI